MKPALKEWRFFDDTDIIKNVTEQLKWFFTKWLPGNVASTFTVAARSV
jgi:hypothetical protein